MLKQLNNDDGGFTLVEVSIILLVLVILSGIMLPQLGNFNRLARYVKVKEDLGAICASMKKMLDEVMLGGFYGEPRWRVEPIGLLIGPGAEPMTNGDGTANWNKSAFGQFTETTDDGTTDVDFTVDTFLNHMQQNKPLGSGNPINRYKNSLDDPEAAGAFFGWRGPYFDEFTSDPWGTRYAANVFALHRDGDAPDHGGIFTSAVVCLSAGMDGTVRTTFNQPMNDLDGDGFNGWKTSDDDIAVVLSSGGPF
jgi:type II secretory pathway pseudopilin PulG